MAEQAPATKSKRRPDRTLVGDYHREKLTALLEHVRGGFAAYDAGQIDAFELDEIIHQYNRATIELWKFCVGGGSGSYVVLAARTIQSAMAEGTDWDWWEAGASRSSKRVLGSESTSTPGEG
jgi:hypothetical protein